MIVGALANLRAEVATALEVDPDVPVFSGPVDAISVPCILVGWADPFLARMTACTYNAAPLVTIVGARIDPDPGIGQIETILEAAIPALAAAGFPAVAVSGPVPYEHGGITYQSARVTLAAPVAME